ncbi:MAG: ABC transporter permease [Terracidiphilus sp.]|nr:ABC transporter permease [Terracidiphilus sp.]
MALIPEQFRQVLRRLGRAPLFTSITLLTLAIGVGANTIVFSVVESVLLKPLPYPQADRLIGVWHKAPNLNLQELNVAPFLYFIDREQSTTLEDIGVYNGDSLSVTGSGKPEHVRAFDVTDGTLPILGAKPILGRLFTRQDDSPHAPATVVLSYAYWQSHFGGNAAAVGQNLILDGKAHQVIGVLPRDFHLLDDTEAALYMPMQWDRSKTKLGNFSYQAVARLKPGVTLQQASADLGRLIPVAVHSFPAPVGFSASIFEKAGLAMNLRPLKKDVIGDIGNVLWVLMGSIAVVLLVACANVANLLLVRVEGRRQELAIRSALGAGRGSITAELLAESLILGFAGSLLGLGLAYWALRILVAAAPTGLPRLQEIGIDLPVLGFTLALALFVSFVIGLLPVFKYSGIRATTGLREGGRALSQSRERHRARKTLVVVQVALALVLLICSGLMIRTFQALAHVSPGFQNPQSLESFRLYIPDTQIPDGQEERVIRMEQAIHDKLAAIPGVTAVGMTTSVPLSGNYSMDPVMAADRTYKEGELPPIRHFHFISPGFFATMGTPLIAGRDLTWDETYQHRPVALVSENLAREYWGSTADALGKKIRVATTDDWYEIIGVVGNVYHDGISQPAPTSVYWPLQQQNFEGTKLQVRRGLDFIIRSDRAGSSAFMKQVQQAVWSVDPDLPLANPTTVGVLYTKSMARTSFTLVMLCVAGAMALLLGIIGIYGVISYAVSQRTREIGIRMALGAQRESLTSLFVRQGLLLACLGAVIGIGVAFAAMRLMRSLLYHVSPVDPITYSVATVTVVAIAYLACYIPSRRACAVNPVNALRAE